MEEKGKEVLEVDEKNGGITDKEGGSNDMKGKEQMLMKE